MPMTLHLHLSFVSLSPATPLPWQLAGLSFICKYLWGKEGEEMLSSFWKTNTASQSCRRPSIWWDMAFRETQACCLQSWAEGWQGQWEHSGGWWQEGARLTLEEEQGKINPNCTSTHKWTCWTSSLWQENAVFYSLNFHRFEYTF